MRYPKELVVFEIISNREYSERKAGDHVEGAGPCCVGTDREWKCGVMTINGALDEEDEYQDEKNLRPLSAAAREMKKLFG